MEEAFATFLANIKLTAVQRDDAVTKHTGVCKKLHDYYYPDREFDGSTKLLIGSYAKRTNIRPARDIDVIFMMPPDCFDSYDDNLSNKQSQLLGDVRAILQSKYPNTPIRAFGKVVVLEFGESQHNVELLPGWEQADGRFMIPNSEDGGSWETWDPRAELKELQESDDATGKTRPLIRMIKKWADNCTVGLKSYAIERAALSFFCTGYSADQPYGLLVRDFFGYLKGMTSDATDQSHIATAYKRASTACEFANEGDEGMACDEWQKVFGLDFPSSVEKAMVSASDTQQLADLSHCQMPPWPVAITEKVHVNGYVYNKQKTKRLGGVNSNGRSLPRGVGLKFVSAPSRPDAELHWQVVNTGPAARAAGGLRGSIFLGSAVRWEETLYPGKHWIECFTVRAGVCVARSGRFYINFKS